MFAQFASTTRFNHELDLAARSIVQPAIAPAATNWK
jgi:hypothetical protein